MTSPAIARTSLLLFCLTLVAGYGDAVAFFGVGVFTANMTGNTVLLGGAVGARFVGRLPGDIGLLLPLVSLASFVAGAMAAAGLLRARARPRRRIAALLLGVAALIAAAALEQHWHAGRAAFVATLSAVMGLQSVVAVHGGIGGVSTTYVTGSIVRAIVNLVGSEKTASLRSEGVANGTVWLLYLAGAIAGTAALRLLGDGALWIPAGVVALLPAVV